MPRDAIFALMAGQPEGADVGVLFASGLVEARLIAARAALTPIVGIVPTGIAGWC